MPQLILGQPKAVAHSRSQELLTFLGLGQRLEHRPAELSGGEQQMIVIGRSLMVDPILLLLDEPSLGLAPIVIAEVFEKIQEIKQMGVSVLMVEQNAHMALGISDRGYVLDLGANRYEGTGHELLHDQKVGELYLGKVSA